MTVILAIEPDPRQASRLSSVLRGRHQTEVLIATSADTAIASIAGRVPDVLLTSQLLSPQDEARLADWLKDLGPAAAHVQALTIPILAPKVTREEPKGGLLAGLRRRARKTGPQGCEPKMFAEHVAAYLDQGVGERPNGGTPQAHAVAEVMPEPAVLEPAVPEPVLVAEAVQPEMVAEAAQPEVVETEGFVGGPVQPMIAVTAAPHDDEDGRWLLTRSPQVIEFSNEPVSPESETLPLAPLPPLAPSQVLTLPREVKPVAPFEVVFEPPELITVRDDANDRRALRSAAAAAAASPVAAAASASDAPPPVQDEWGFFDPNKCGFSALLDKLDEITDDDRQSAADVEASVRIVTHY